MLVGNKFMIRCCSWGKVIGIIWILFVVINVDMWYLLLISFYLMLVFGLCLLGLVLVKVKVIVVYFFVWLWFLMFKGSLFRCVDCRSYLLVLVCIVGVVIGVKSGV